MKITRTGEIWAARKTTLLKEREFNLPKMKLNFFDTKLPTHNFQLHPPPTLSRS